MSSIAISVRNRKILNFVSFQAAWWACVLGASEGLPLLGPVVVLAWVGVQIGSSDEPLGELFVVALVVALGALVDAALVAIDATRFTQPALAGTASPAWMLALWANFAATLGSSLVWLAKKPWLAAGLGAAGGPLAYLGASSFGAIELTPPVALSLAAVAVAWTVAVPVCFGLRSLVIGRSSRPAAPVGVVL